MFDIIQFMESTQNLKRRIRSVQNIGQITKAMELVAATKMRRSQELALNSRPHAYTALEILAVISRLKDLEMPELMQEKKIERTAFLIVASDKGLAGSFNGSVFRKFEHYVRENHIDLHDPKYSFIAVGQKAKSYLEHRGHAPVRSFLRVGDFKQMEEVNPLTNTIVNGYLEYKFDEVISFSTNFITALRQDVLVRELLPISFEKIKESIDMLIPQAGKFSHYLHADSLNENKDVQYTIEPSPKEVLDSLSRELLKIRVYHMILEANASEHSARRVAMKSASDNASELGQNLNIVYNKSRQAAITNQIIEVTAGAQSMQ
jgi:F-type H+-transporting ATPase subunit gamma